MFHFLLVDAARNSDSSFRNLEYKKTFYLTICKYCTCTVKPALRDHWQEGQPVLKDQIFLAEGPTCQCN